MNLMEIGRELDVKRMEYKRRWDAYPVKVLADGQKAKDIPSSDLEGLRCLMDEINDLATKHDVLVSAESVGREIEAKAAEMVRPVNRLGFGGSGGVAESLLESAQWQGRIAGKFGEVELSDGALGLIELKATMSTSAGFGPQTIRDMAVVPLASRPPQLLDFLRIEPTDQNSVKFMKQSTRTNASAPKAEGTAFDEATLVYTEATTDIRKIGVYLPVTEEQIEDEAGIRAVIEGELRTMVRQKLDEQITIGDGTGVNIRGLYSATGAQTQARGTDTEFDQILKGMTKVRITGRARPNLAVLHTNNYQRLALTKTSEGVYIFGAPSGEPLQRIWGIQIAMSEALTEGTGMVVDTDYAKVRLRRDLTVAASDSHGTNFISGILAIRAHVRAGLQVLRDEAVCKLTGMQS